MRLSLIAPDAYLLRIILAGLEQKRKNEGLTHEINLESSIFQICYKSLEEGQL